MQQIFESLLGFDEISHVKVALNPIVALLKDSLSDGLLGTAAMFLHKLVVVASSTCQKLNPFVKHDLILHRLPVWLRVLKPLHLLHLVGFHVIRIVKFLGSVPTSSVLHVQ